MKISWTSLKVSIAGARLSHLVQKDKIWDHGTMVEQVKNIFYKIERAKNKNDAEPVKKNVTTQVYEKLNEQIKTSRQPVFKNTVLTEVSIIEVNVRIGKGPDRFTALIKGKRKVEADEIIQTFKTTNKNFGIENFSERWFFTRQGEWWVLDNIKNKRIFKVE
jgi:hypothetical protein